MSRRKVEVSVIIVNYNKRQMTQECIDSVFDKTQDVKFEVILVDNASTDGSREHFSKEPRIQYIYNQENVGFGRANNIGMEAASGNYFFLLNNDTLLRNNAVKLFFDYAEAHGPVAFYGGWLHNAKGELVHSGAKMMSVSSDLHIASLAWTLRIPLLRNIAGATKNVDAVPNGQVCQKVGYVTGADLFLNRSIVDQVGMFDPRFFMYCEESDWQKRAQEKGIPSYLIKGPQIIHLQDFDSKPTAAGAILRFESKKLFIRKHYSRLTYYYYRTAYFLLRFLPLLLSNNYSWADRKQLVKKLIEK